MTAMPEGEEQQRPRGETLAAPAAREKPLDRGGMRDCGDTELAATYRTQLDRSKRLIEVRHVLVNTREAAND